MRFALLFVSILFIECGPPADSPDATAPNGAASSTSISASASADAERAVRDVVQQFGQRLRNVSLLGPRHVLESSIRREYGPYVTPELLDVWLAEPTRAPGRLTSSPWPERIEVKELGRASGDRWTVSGEIVESTSTGAGPGRALVRIDVVRAGNEWRIASFHSTAPGAPASADEPPSGEPSAQDAAEVIESYYAAIDAREYERAYRLWGNDGAASGTTLEEFRAGFADTANVDVEAGTPGRIETAAGSRYTEIPVEVTATTPSGATQRFRGTYVLRRSVVDGATVDQRQWRISSAKIIEI